MPDDDTTPDAVAAWEAEHGRPWGDCGIEGCTDSHAHAPPPKLDPIKIEHDPDRQAEMLRLNIGND